MRLSTVRRPLVTAAILIAFGLAAPLHAEGTAQQNAAPKAENGSAPAGTSAQDNRKTSGSNDQSGPSNAAATSDQNKQGDNATHSTAGRAGTEEPGSHAPSQDTAAVSVNGALNVPGAPADSQTVPAKFSKRNDAIDHVAIMAMPLGLSDAQKRTIVDAVRAGKAPVVTTAAKPAQELPWDVVVQDMPASANDPAFARLKIVRAQDRVLLIEPSNRIVVGEIPN
jgi:hypothetical protein